MTFRDYFSDQASSYLEGRPSYPIELFEYLAKITTAHNLAWDCATGNGQTATMLAGLFKKVIATDASAKQIAFAPAISNIEYSVALAEKSPLDDVSVDLITVSQALHWFDLPKFFSEANRVLKPGGVLAIWSYGLHSIEPEIDQIVDELYRFTLKDYWTPERIMVEQGYGSIDFPFKGLTAPNFVLRVEWSQSQFESYLRSWSATNNYIKDKGIDPVALISPKLSKIWRNDSKQITWPLALFARRKPT